MSTTITMTSFYKCPIYIVYNVVYTSMIIIFDNELTAWMDRLLVCAIHSASVMQLKRDTVTTIIGWIEPREALFCRWLKVKFHESKHLQLDDSEIFKMIYWQYAMLYWQWPDVYSHSKYQLYFPLFLNDFLMNE